MCMHCTTQFSRLRSSRINKLCFITLPYPTIIPPVLYTRQTHCEETCSIWEEQHGDDLVKAELRFHYESSDVSFIAQSVYCSKFISYALLAFMHLSFNMK